MLRDKCTFSDDAKALAGTARTRPAFHEERLTWWKAKQNEDAFCIRSDGIEIDEKLICSFHNRKVRDRDGKILIRADLRKQRAECFDKFVEQTARITSDHAREQAVAANPGSGLPDFRGSQGFWQAYPALAKAGIHFQDIVCPNAFSTHTRLAWGFYGHRLKLYRTAEPHAGFSMLNRFGCRKKHGSYVFTSNVDGQFRKAGFDPRRIVEVHGSIHHLQCLHGCLADIWPADTLRPVVDNASCQLLSGFPRCPHCGTIARPNVLMFGDWSWLSVRTDLQKVGLHAWLQQVQRPVVIEVGAGRDIVTVRRFGEQVRGATLIRINPRDTEVPAGAVSLQLGGLDGLQRIAAALDLH